MVKEWKTEPNSRISTTSTSIRPVAMAVAKPANTSPMISASPVSWMRVPAGMSLTSGSAQTMLEALAELGARRHVGADDDAALAVEAVDRRRTLAEADRRRPTTAAR